MGGPRLSSPRRWHTISCNPKDQPLTQALVNSHAKNDILFVTFTNAVSSKYAANWAKQLQAIGTSGLVGVVEVLPPVYSSAILTAAAAFLVLGS